MPRGGSGWDVRPGSPASNPGLGRGTPGPGAQPLRRQGGGVLSGVRHAPRRRPAPPAPRPGRRESWQAPGARGGQRSWAAGREPRAPAHVTPVRARRTAAAPGDAGALRSPGAGWRWRGWRARARRRGAGGLRGPGATAGRRGPRARARAAPGLRDPSPRQEAEARPAAAAAAAAATPRRVPGCARLPPRAAPQPRRAPALRRAGRGPAPPRQLRGGRSGAGGTKVCRSPPGSPEAPAAERRKFWNAGSGRSSVGSGRRGAGHRLGGGGDGPSSGAPAALIRAPGSPAPAGGGEGAGEPRERAGRRAGEPGRPPDARVTGPPLPDPRWAGRPGPESSEGSARPQRGRPAPNPDRTGPVRGPRAAPDRRRDHRPFVSEAPGQRAAREQSYRAAEAWGCESAVCARRAARPWARGLGFGEGRFGLLGLLGEPRGRAAQSRQAGLGAQRLPAGRRPAWVLTGVRPARGRWVHGPCQAPGEAYPARSLPAAARSPGGAGSLPYWGVDLTVSQISRPRGTESLRL
ncbi:translation initiation factor IF-2-like [Dipodomys spectabilis]|uniref:translation initiation factor IF-2-like n=1 Tax=Dipodomys spectabilis TaxID=105255 RepID=UPI001C53DBB2|nr:translation initiation factor IF-2-like [Dipodomys spectabilis]